MDIERRRAISRKSAAKMRAANPEKSRANGRALYARNRERLLTKAAERYAANPDKYIARSAEWAVANPERHRTRSAEWRRANPERQRALTARWRSENPEHQAEYLKTYRKAKPESYIAGGNRRRARKIMAGGEGVTPYEWREILVRSLGLCAYCGFRLALTMDHIDPLALGGEHSAENATACCRSCNSSKNDTPLLVWLAKKAALRGVCLS